MGQPHRRRHLPVDLLWDILARLPVKSLVRFRSVSCSWHSLIDDPDFVERHLALSKGFGKKRIITGNEYGEFRVKSCSLRSLYTDPWVEVVSHPEAPSPGSGHPLRIEGSDNGIVCIVNWQSDDIYLWNPSTRQTKMLPPLEKLCFYGFGHASLVDDYKVICVLSTENAEAVNVYSLRTDSWRQISQEAHHSFPSSYLPSRTLLNGALHFMSPTRSPISFDLSTETFREIPMYDGHEPCGGDGGDDDDVMYPRFGVASGCLCVLSGSLYRETEVWVMKEYGVAESWYHYATISPPPPHAHLWGCTTRIVEIIEIFLEKGEILMQCGSLNFIWYNTRDNTYRDSPLHEGDSVYHKTAAVHVESLVSLA